MMQLHNVITITLLVALLLVLLICTVILVDDGLLKNNTGCTTPSLSLTLYVESLNCTLIATNNKLPCNYGTMASYYDIVTHNHYLL